MCFATLHKTTCWLLRCSCSLSVQPSGGDNTATSCAKKVECLDELSASKSQHACNQPQLTKSHMLICAASRSITTPNNSSDTPTNALWSHSRKGCVASIHRPVVSLTAPACMHACNDPPQNLHPRQGVQNRPQHMRCTAHYRLAIRARLCHTSDTPSASAHCPQRSTTQNTTQLSTHSPNTSVESHTTIRHAAQHPSWTGGLAGHRHRHGRRNTPHRLGTAAPSKSSHISSRGFSSKPCCTQHLVHMYRLKCCISSPRL